MKKLIIKKQLEIVCDNPNCDYKIPVNENEIELLSLFINIKCPNCREVLLTEKDYKQQIKLLKFINWINKWFSWLLVFYSKKQLSQKTKLEIKVYKGIHIKENNIN